MATLAQTDHYVPITGRQSTPIYWWGAIGTLFLILEVYVFGAWILSDQFTPTLPGADPMPWYTTASMYFFQTTNVIAAIALIWWGVNTCRREGRVTTTMLFIVAWLLTLWQDPLANNFRLYFSYNSHMVNMGSWVNFIPGWVMPNGNLIPEPLIFNIGAYASAQPMVIFLCAWIMRKAKQRWPHMGVMGLLGTAFIAMVIADLVIEGTWVRTGLYAFVGAVHSWSLFGGAWYQFPIYQSLFWAPVLVAGGALYYFRDDKGQALVERGSEKITNPVANTFMRLMSISAVFNIAYFTYNMVMCFITFQMDPMPTYPSYLTNGICGAGTHYECPGPDVHVPLPGSGPLPPFTGRN